MSQATAFSSFGGYLRDSRKSVRFAGIALAAPLSGVALLSTVL